MCVCVCVCVCVCACENLWVVLSQLREFLVVWSEVVAPLTDAVSLINDESRQFPSTVEVPQCGQ